MQSTPSGDSSKADYLSTKNRLEAAAAQLLLLDVNPERLLREGIQPLLQVKAPISGYISRVKMNTEKYIQLGEPLCEIIDKLSLVLCLTTYKKDPADMKTGSPVQFRVNGYGQNRISCHRHFHRSAGERNKLFPAGICPYPEPVPAVPSENVCNSQNTEIKKTIIFAS